MAFLLGQIVRKTVIGFSTVVEKRLCWLVISREQGKLVAWCHGECWEVQILPRKGGGPLRLGVSVRGGAPGFQAASKHQQAWLSTSMVLRPTVIVIAPPPLILGGLGTELESWKYRVQFCCGEAS